MLKSDSIDLPRLRQLTSDVQQIGHAVSSAAYNQAASGNGGRKPAGSQGAGNQSSGNEDVIDAEFKQTR